MRGTQYIVVVSFRTIIKDAFAGSYSYKVFEMSDFDSRIPFEEENQQLGPINENCVLDGVLDEDLLMEQILENINTTPIGQVLKKIASLPEIRSEKVLDVRRQLTEGQYDLNGRLDVVLDKVLEDLTA